MNKIDKYRQKIKQNVINGYQQPIPHTTRQQNNKKNNDHVKFLQPTLSRSNIRKNPSDLITTSRIHQQDHRKRPQQNQIYNQNRQSQMYGDNISNSRIQAKNSNDPLIIPIKSKISTTYKSPHQMLNNNPSNPYDQRTAQKTQRSKSPMRQALNSLQTQLMTKRKQSYKQSDKSANRGPENSILQRTANFNHLSSFDTFSQRQLSPIGNHVLPPLFPQATLVSNTAEHQVKILLQQNQILSLHLNEKLQRIKSLQRELKTAVKSQILHQEKYGIEVSNLVAQNEMMKKSSDEQMKTLVCQVKKLNEELIQKQQQWQQRVNMIRKTNLEQQQQTKRHQMQQQEKYKSQIQELKIKISTMTRNHEVQKQDLNAIIQNLKNQKQNLNQALQKFNHLNKMQKSQLSIQHDNKIKEIKQEYMKKIQMMNIDKIRKQNQLNGIIQGLRKQLKKTSHELQDLKHEKQFNEVKQLQQKGKLLLQMREVKESVNKIKQEEKNKDKKITQAELLALKNKYQLETQQLYEQIKKLQHILQTRNDQIAKLYKQIKDIRKSYQDELNNKNNHINNQQQKMKYLIAQHMEQQQMLKIKIAELTQSNQSAIKLVYENKISEKQHIIIDKQETIKSLRDKINNLFKEIDQNSQLHIQQIKQYQLKIQQLEQQMSSRALKQKNLNKASNNQSIMLKQNITRQSQSYEKTLIVKDQTIKKLQKIIQTKDLEIEQLQNKLQLLKKAHKQEVSQLKQQSSLIINEKQDLILQLKQQLQYIKKQQIKKYQQFTHDKEYFSNQLRQVKSKGQKDFNEWVQKLSSQLNQIKTQNKFLSTQLNKVTQQYTEYKKLWNEQETINKLLKKEEEFKEKMNQSFTLKYQKLVQSHQKDIETIYKPKINLLTQLINEKQQQIQDMKVNYHELELKFEQVIESKQTSHAINEKVLNLAHSNSLVTQNFINITK